MSRLGSKTSAINNFLKHIKGCTIQLRSLRFKLKIQDSRFFIEMSWCIWDYQGKGCCACDCKSYVNYIIMFMHKEYMFCESLRLGMSWRFYFFTQLKFTFKYFLSWNPNWSCVNFCYDVLIFSNYINILFQG